MDEDLKLPIIEPDMAGAFEGDVWFGHPVMRSLGTHRWQGGEWVLLPSEMESVLELLAVRTAQRDAAADRERKLEEALRPFALFFDAAIGAWSDGCDLDGFDIQEIAASLGLLRETVFNSEVHTDELGVDAQDGDPWFVLSDMASKAIRDARVVQAKEGGA
jgi:hypothetical protein